MNGILLETINIDKYFGGLHAVNNVSFTVPPGIIMAVIGPNGAGKTTLFNLISGSLKPNSGEVKFRDRTITGLKEYKIAEAGISRTFQTTKLFHHMTILENVMVGRHTKTRSEILSCILSLPRTHKEEKAMRKRALEILESLKLAGYADEEASNLPFGKQRIAEIARALATEPALLLLDEPAAGLNMYETEELARLILKIKEWGITVLLVEHDISLVMNISDAVVVLDRGKKLAEGSPGEIQKNPDVINVYLGEDDA
ncbi:MAG: ABC transporter ATP-binding protein [Spirochaetales bacterium]|nr:ABC transporter ATP-binding protein [Spirochaetales bacterium]